MRDLPDGVDLTRPSQARLYDYLLGGTDNYAIDRQAVEHFLAQSPDARRSAIENRRFLIRVVEQLCSRGARQFLDLGAGLPTAENTHQVAQRAGNGARVVYVDRDPSVLAHAHALLGEQERTAYVHGDIRDPGTVLEGARELLDFTRPVVVLAVAVLHFVPDEDDPAGLMRRYAGELVPGSHVVVSSASTTGLDPEVLALSESASERFRFPLHMRSREEIEGLFGGAVLEDPGVVPVQDWPVPSGAEPLTVPMLGGVARVP